MDRLCTLRNHTRKTPAIGAQPKAHLEQRSHAPNRTWDTTTNTVSQRDERPACLAASLTRRATFCSSVNTSFPVMTPVLKPFVWTSTSTSPVKKTMSANGAPDALISTYRPTTTSTAQGATTST